MRRRPWDDSHGTPAGLVRGHGFTEQTHELGTLGAGAESNFCMMHLYAVRRKNYRTVVALPGRKARRITAGSLFFGPAIGTISRTLDSADEL